VTPQFIAEVSSNHNRDLERTLRFVDAAAKAGCDAVKFQLFRVNELFAPEIVERSEAVQARREWELPLEFLAPIAEACTRSGLEFHCTPFYLQAVEQLDPLVDVFKVSSYELLWDDLLVACAATGKPVILSTGMANLSEVQHAVQTLRRAGVVDLTLLHCVSSYPAAAEDCNLAVIETLRNAFDCRIGWSDHSVDPAVISRAVHRWGAEVVELHFDLDERGEEFAGGHCWLPETLRSLIADVRRGLEADGDGVKEPSVAEAAEKDWRADPSDGLRPLRHLRADWKP